MSLSVSGQQTPCKKPAYGKWDLDFDDKEMEDYTIWFKLDKFIQFLKNGKEKRGQLKWDRSNCTYTLTFDKTFQDSTTVEVLIIVEDVKEKTARFKITPMGNLNVTLGQGKMKKQDTHIVLY